MNTIIINEQQEKILFSLIKEDYDKFLNYKIDKVKKFLDSKYTRVSFDDVNNDGKTYKKKIVIEINSNGESVKKLDSDDLLSVLEDEFYDLFPSNERRANLIKIMRSWYERDPKLNVGII